MVNSWYLLGWLNYLRKEEEYLGNARFYLNKAKQVHAINPSDDDALVGHIEELLVEIGPGEEEEGEGQGADPSVLNLPSQEDVLVDRVAEILDQEGDEGDGGGGGVEEMED